MKREVHPLIELLEYIAKERGCGNPDCEECAHGDEPINVSHKVEVYGDVATSLGLSPDSDPATPENLVRLHAAALIMSMKQWAAQTPSFSLKDAMLRKTGVDFAEQAVFAAIGSFNLVAESNR